MKVIVDILVWSLVLKRKQPDNRLVNILRDLIADGRVIMIGAVREFLSIIKHQQ